MLFFCLRDTRFRGTRISASFVFQLERFSFRIQNERILRDARYMRARVHGPTLSFTDRPKPVVPARWKR
jgi:hypothetical protein